MGIEIVRTPSETPNITNVDDIIPMRYAYGNQDGYVIGRGTEVDGTYENGTFTVGAGRIVVQGVEIDINANGATTTLDNGTGNRYYHVYLQVNLNSNVVGLVNYYSDSSYDDIEEPHTDNPNLVDGGTAYLLLYSIKLNGSTQVEKNKLILPINYANKRLVWTGNANIGVTNPSVMSNAFGHIKEKENVTYELHGEINDQFSNKQTFIAKIRINAHDNDGYISKCVISVDYNSNSYGTYITTTQLKVFRHNDYFFAAMLMQQVNLSTNAVSYISNNSTINRIYEIEE